MADFDYIIVGSGINALVAAAMLGKKGKKSSFWNATTASAVACIRTKSLRRALPTT